MYETRDYLIAGHFPRKEGETLFDYQARLCSFAETAFADIWEPDGAWLLGRNILSDIVRFLQGKCLAVQLNGSSLDISIPLPTIRTKISPPYMRTGSEEQSIYWSIPPELRSLFEDKCREIVDSQPFWDHAFMNSFLGRVATPVLLTQAQHHIRAFEEEAASRSNFPLWKCAAVAFGLEWWNLAPPAFAPEAYAHP